MLVIFIKRYTVRYLAWSRTYGCAETECVKVLHDRPIELRYRDLPKRHCSLLSANRLNDELVINEIKTDFEGGSTMRDY
jgi:hypothetical protein